MEAPNFEELEMVRRAIEKELVWRRDNRVSTIRNNGCVIKEMDGSFSSTIRLGLDEAFKIGFDALIEMRKNPQPFDGQGPLNIVIMS